MHNMKMRSFKSLWIKPLVFFQIYLTASVVLFFFGPWPWEVDNPELLAAYLMLSQVFIFFGYMLSWGKVRNLQEKDSIDVSIEGGEKYLRKALLITFVLMIPTSLSRTGSIVPDVLAGLSNTGEAYNDNFNRLLSGNPYVVVEYIRMVLSVPLTAVLPLSVFYWGRLSKSLKALSVVAIIFNLCVYIATGTNKGIADLVITLPWLIYLGLSAGMARRKISTKKIAALTLVTVMVFLAFFGAGQSQRSGGVGEFGVFNTGAGVIQSNQLHVVSTLLSENQRIVFESLTRYVGQGYYALSMAFNIDSPSTFGLGSSMFLARNADALTGGDYFTAQSLPGILEKKSGWGMFSLWHSIYPWLASDFGFVGTLFVIGFFSYLLGLGWGSSIATADPYWVTLTYLLIITFYYIPGNNQVFQSGETCIAFIAIVSMISLRKLMRSQKRQSRDGVLQ